MAPEHVVLFMDDNCEPESIEDVLDCVEEAGSKDRRVSIAEIVEHIGEGAFAPLMLLPALVIISPLSAIFGLPSICGFLIGLIALQIVLGREKLWLPAFIRNRDISSSKVDKMVGWLARPARFIDGLTRERLTFLIEQPADRLWAALCLLLALIIPFFELVPMSATVIASAIALFALAMVARDGLLVLLALSILAGAVWLFATMTL